MKNKLRTMLTRLAGVLALSGWAVAAPPPRERVAVDAKWILHADLVSLRASQMGHYLQTNYLDEPLQEFASNLQFDAQALLAKVTSITAYGSGFKKQDPQASLATGVLLLQADVTAQQIVEGALAAQLLANTNGPLRKVQTQPYPMYAMGGDLYGAIQPNGVIVLSKSRDRIELAAQVLAGTQPNLTSSKAFTDFPPVSDSFFFLGIAEDFNQLADLPPQARVLQMADGLRIVLGEKADQLFAGLALRSKSDEVVTQIQQVLQGIVALFSLGQPENRDLAELVRGTLVTTNQRVVSVESRFPVAKALTLLTDAGRSDSDSSPKRHKPGKKKAKAKTKESSEAKPADSDPEKAKSKPADQ